MIASRVCLLVALVLLTSLVVAQDKSSSARVIEKDEVVAGGPKDSLEVRHLVLRGSNEAIGRTLAELARERYQVQPTASVDPLRTRAQRRYFEKHYPILHDRLRGVAGAFGKRLDDDSWNCSDLGFSDLKAGCSVFYVPPARTTTGTGIVSRDYDFTLGSMRFGALPPGMLHPTARPYIMELHPDRGYASLSMVAYDLLSGVIDGMNSEGLTVALLADDELHQKFPMEPTRSNGVGLGALQTLRFLLDTCATVEEAKEALLQTKQYYEFIQVHYLIADRHGKSFVWEYSHAHNKEYIVENPGQPLVTTNFSLHRHLHDNKPPSVEQARKICHRYSVLSEKLLTHDGKLSDDDIKATHKQVDAVSPTSKARPAGRTFWHALYYPEQRRAQFSYYLRDEPQENGKPKIVRTDYLEFKLK